MSRRKLYIDCSEEESCTRFVKAVNKGLLKIMSKMGISTLQSYRGAQIFEIVGLNSRLVDRYFTGTVSRVQGVGLKELADEVLLYHRDAFAEVCGDLNELRDGGMYQWRRRGESHLYNPATIALLQEAVQKDDYELYRKYASLISGEQAALCTLRGLFKLKKAAQPVPLEEVVRLAQCRGA